LLVGSRNTNRDVEAVAAKIGLLFDFCGSPCDSGSQVSEAHSEEAKKPDASVAGRGARLRVKLNMNSSPALLKRQSEYLLPHQRATSKC